MSQGLFVPRLCRVRAFQHGRDDLGVLSEVRRTEVRVPPHHSLRLPRAHLLDDVERGPVLHQPARPGVPEIVPTEIHDSGTLQRLAPRPSVGPSDRLAAIGEHPLGMLAQPGATEPRARWSSGTRECPVRPSPGPRRSRRRCAQGPPATTRASRRLPCRSPVASANRHDVALMRRKLCQERPDLLGRDPPNAPVPLPKELHLRRPVDPFPLEHRFPQDGPNRAPGSGSRSTGWLPRPSPRRSGRSARGRLNRAAGRAGAAAATGPSRGPRGAWPCASFRSTT